MDFEEFLDITPRFFHVLTEKYQVRLSREQEMTEVMGAQLVAMVRQCGFVQFKESASARDFMPSEWKRKAKVGKKTKRRTREAIADEYRNVMAAVAK